MDNPNCKQCGKKILVSNKGSNMFCSTDCYHKNYKGRKINRIKDKAIFEERKCIVCDALFKVSIRNNREYRKRLCSKQCQIVVSTANFIRISKARNTRTPEENKQHKLKQGRDSYLKHRETRLIYYKKLVAIRKGIKGDFSLEQWNEVLSEQKNKCVLCGVVMIVPTIDHKIPISKWGLWKQARPVDYECNDIQNIQALCKSCNSSKRDKIIY